MRLTRRIVAMVTALTLAITAIAVMPTQRATASTPTHPTWVAGTSGGTTETKDPATPMLTDNDVGWVLAQPSTYAEVTTMYATNALLAGHEGKATASTGNLEATPLRDTGQPVTTTATSERQPATIAGTKFTMNSALATSASKEAKVEGKKNATASPARSAG